MVVYSLKAYRCCSEFISRLVGMFKREGYQGKHIVNVENERETERERDGRGRVTTGKNSELIS